jgi:hypothetical protein
MGVTPFEELKDRLDCQYLKDLGGSVWVEFLSLQSDALLSSLPVRVTGRASYLPPSGEERGN